MRKRIDTRRAGRQATSRTHEPQEPTARRSTGDVSKAADLLGALKHEIGDGLLWRAREAAAEQDMAMSSFILEAVEVAANDAERLRTLYPDVPARTLRLAISLDLDHRVKECAGRAGMPPADWLRSVLARAVSVGGNASAGPERRQR